MVKTELLKYAEDVKQSLCRSCGQVCKLNGYEPCLERKSIEQLIDFAKNYMDDAGNSLALGIYDRR